MENESLKKIYKNNNRVKVFKTKKNSGTCAHPRNVGIKNQRVVLFVFVISDDLWEKKIRNTINEIKRQKYYNFYWSQIFFKKITVHLY